MSSFPETRLHRLRSSPTMRRMLRETNLSVSDLIYPIFVTHGRDIRTQIRPMPGIYQFSLDQLDSEVGEVSQLGIPAILLFGIPAIKNPEGTESYQPTGIVQEAVRVIKQTVPDLIVITDVCMCEYTDHGHCGTIRNGDIDNDLTLELLGKIALSHADAGSDMVAPSAMMDGQVSAVRKALDTRGFSGTPIMAYSSKYASAFYGPFRIAADSAPQFGDRSGYQLDPSNGLEAIREIEQDIGEGADIVMVKPALAYLDVISDVKNTYAHPVAAYNVSGEYSMVKAASENGWIDEHRVVMEILTSVKRAGADMIISYHAKEAARWLAENN